MDSDSGFREIDIEQALHILQPDGPMSRLIKGYESREQQLEMLRNTIEAYRDDAIALIEAGTGTGKSLAYLIPAILWAVQNKERTLISTKTITLQEQLLHKDIPLAAKALGVQIKAVLVKGMSNYLCPRKLEDAKQEKRTLTDTEAEELEQIEDWQEITSDGSLSELSFVPSRHSWERVCAEGDACSQRKCPFFKRCHFFKARGEAEEAQILVVNHSMLFADLAFRAESEDADPVGLLPSYTRVVLDEAHEIEEVATEFFADKAAYLQLLRLMGRLGSDTQGKLTLLAEKIRTSSYIDTLKEGASILSRLTIDLPATRIELLRQAGDAFQAFTLFLQNFEKHTSHEIKLRLLPEHLSHPDWENEVLPAAGNFIETCNRYVTIIKHMESDIRHLENHKLDQHTQGVRYDIQALVGRLSTLSSNLADFLEQEPLSSKVKWIEARQLKSLTNILLVNAELDISKILVESLFKKFETIVLCSATLTTNNTFDFIKKRLGILPEKLPERTITENIYAAPFDYEKQVMLLVPTDMPNPNEGGFIDAVSENVWQSIKASKGNAFVLFTSYAALQQCYEKLASRCEENRFPLFRQGDDTRNSLLKQFKATDYSVLFGTDSFWQGVDVAGEALRCVIIVKLPFQVPSEPIIQARAEAIAAEGGNPFFHYAVPNAIVKFKQGFGRLIRKKTDRGCFVCLDPRVINKNYGRQFLNSLPPAKQILVTGNQLMENMQEFYRKTYHLVKK